MIIVRLGLSELKAVLQSYERRQVLSQSDEAIEALLGFILRFITIIHAKT